MASSTPSIIRPTRRTRIVCISDTHNCTVKLPKGDVLIHAGDLTNQGSFSELSKSIQWLEKADFEAKIVIAGNHDISLDSNFYAEYGQRFHNQEQQDSARCLALLTSSRTITYLCHNSTTIRLQDPKGPATEFTVFGSPFSPRNGVWAFGYERSGPASGAMGEVSTSKAEPSAAEIWNSIPMSIDILVTHTPPYAHCDSCPDRPEALGCVELQKALGRVRPRLHVCGHVHHGRGSERVTWEMGTPGGEVGVERWEDPSPDLSSAKISLVDLISRGGNRPLDSHDVAAQSTVSRNPSMPDPSDSPRKTTLPQFHTQPLRPTGQAGWDDDPGPGPSRPSNSSAGPKGLDRVNSVPTDPAETLSRMGSRRESCIVNCAIVATSWPHAGGRRLNKPIVVDLDLPIWR
ncbi:Metallo-dependent phosphatase-like protein [Podospora didyma]|uniref:Metallo-dependent phosphatase-like protein n=1 Tax=Podospora didyma TaxID=330526 RepID=A0AAE0K6A2_9PEZI|nr:Metallo-dependent phosphatase-like protein [Podospora didyma]